MTLVIDRKVLPEPLLPFIGADRIMVEGEADRVVLTPAEDKPEPAVVFWDNSKTKKNSTIKMSVNKMCGVFAGRLSVCASDDFAKNKQKEMGIEV